jgi:hypothetical protein
MGAFAMFSLKDPSLLSYVDKYEARKENLAHIYHVHEVPTDNGMRKILDPVDPMHFRPFFQSLYEEPKVQEIVKKRMCFASLGGYVVIAADGTEHFCSGHTSCPHCMQRTLKNGEVQNYHQLVGACIVHPQQKTVLPVFLEPITRQDGATKNDCEHNAFKRLVPNIEVVLPGLKKLVLLDGLFTDGPAVRATTGAGMDFITVVKDGYILVQAQRLEQNAQLQTLTWVKDGHLQCTAQWAHSLVLNGANQDIMVDFLQYQETDSKTGKMIYASKWITSLHITEEFVPEFVEVARAKWKIENETWNVLKNHGYNFEHNYGHGKVFLCSVMATIMFLAFLVDQLTEATCWLFQKALKVAKTKRDLRQYVRTFFDYIPSLSMNFIYEVIARNIKVAASP